MLDNAVTLEPSLHGCVSVHPISPTRVELRIAGDLPPVWPERLAASLAARGVDVIHGEAECRGTTWTGRFELDSAHAATSGATLDYVAVLSAVVGFRQARPIALLGYGLVRLAGALRLAIQAEDRPALWADTLSKLKYLGLYPKRLTLDTESRLVTQCFWLTSHGHRDPDVQTERALREFLVKNRQLRRS